MLKNVNELTWSDENEKLKAFYIGKGKLMAIYDTGKEIKTHSLIKEFCISPKKV